MSRKLKEFPSEGWCRTLDLSLRRYLTSRPYTRVERVEITQVDAIGVAWNSTSHWFVKTDKSSKQEYTFDEIIPFIYNEEFIVGKWYKANNNYYLKYSHTTKGRAYNQIHGEIISVARYRKNDYIANSDWEKEMLKNGPLTDLSEIREFLPDGHVDKINKKYAGRWYKLGNAYRKCVKDSIDNTFSYVEWIEDGKYCIKEQPRIVNFADRWEEVPLSEVEKYFIKHWSEGRYIVALVHEAVSIKDFKIGDIAILTSNDTAKVITGKGKNTYGWILIPENEETGCVKWFATLNEAEEFSKSLTKSPPPKSVNSETDMKSNKEILLEEAKKRYPIGTKFEIAHKPGEFRTVKSHELHKDTFCGTNKLSINFLTEGVNECKGASVYYNGKWAKIVEKAFVLPQNWYIKITNDNYNILNAWFQTHYSGDILYPKGIVGVYKYGEEYIVGITEGSTKDEYFDFGNEITLEQFKKYVYDGSYGVINTSNVTETKAEVNVHTQEIYIPEVKKRVPECISVKVEQFKEVVIPTISIPKKELIIN